MRGLCLILFLSCVSRLVYSQDITKVDSLKEELKHTKNKASVLNELANAFIDDKPEEAFRYATQASEEALKKNDKKQMAHAMWTLGRYYLLINDYNKSNLYTDSARNLYHTTKQSRSEVNCMVMKANTLFLQAKYEESLTLFKEAAKESKKNGAKGIYCSAILNIGRIYLTWGEVDSALNYYENSLAIAKEINNKYLEGNAYGFIGELYLDQKKYDLAIDNILKAMEIFESERITAKVPYWQTMLGTGYLDMNNYEEALKYLRVARKNFIEMDDRWGLEELYRYIGSVHREMNDLDSAWIYYDRSLRLSREINEKAGECMALKSLGEVLIVREEYIKAINYLNEALRLNKEIRSTSGQIDILIDLGTCYISIDSLSKGISLLNLGLILADSLNLETARMNLHKELSLAYKKSGSYKKALQHYEEYTTLNDSIFMEESNSHFIEMEQKYQSEQREKEISRLKIDKLEQDVTIKNQRSTRNILLVGLLFFLVVGVLLYRSNRIRKKANDEKEALLKEIHHRVKNNLQIISSLLSIQSENVTDTSVISAVKESQSRVKAMALIHQLLYQEKELTRIDFATYLPQLIHAVSSIFKKKEDTIDVDIDASGIVFDIDTSIPLGLIITELVSNAFKYAFNGQSNGKIRIELKPADNDWFVLTVADNGKGLPAGIRIEELDSMGLRLVKMLTGQLEGDLNYEYNKGAIFTIKFTDTV
jgi:two-component sensor histidine kinase